MQQAKPYLYTTLIVLFYFLLVMLWQYSAPHYPNWAIIFPPPSQVLQAIWHNLPLLATGIWQTLWQAGVGLFAGAIIALMLGLLLQPLPWLAKLLYPGMYAWQASPTLATTSLVLLLMGFGATSKIVLILIVTFYPIYVGFSGALSRVDRQWIDLLTSYGANRWQLFRMVRWPSAIVGFFSGVRVACTYLISVTITAQWLGGQDGLGNTLLRSRRSYDYSLMMATVMLSIVLSLLFIFVSVQIEAWVMRKYHLVEEK
jgi:ABC-type nitrate/sulfonate/bicarbonate transport system permease component